MKLKLKIKIIGSEAGLFLVNKNGRIADKSEWTDKRDLSEKLLKKIDKLLKRNNLAAKDISKYDFYCDSPYFRKGGEQAFLPPAKGKCGFMSWQIGEITTKILNWKLEIGNF